MNILMDYIINLLFTLLQIVANDTIISHIVIMILIKADLMGKMPKKQEGLKALRLNRSPE